MKKILIACSLVAIVSWVAFGSLIRVSSTLAVRGDNGFPPATYPNTIEMTGYADASVAAAGKLGEIVTGVVASGSAKSLVTATGTNVIIISLTAGDWDVSGNINFVAASATVTATSGGITTTSLTVPVDGTEVYSGVQGTLLSENDSVTLPRKQINVLNTTNVYLVGKSTFSPGTVKAFGSITARRVR